MGQDFPTIAALRRAYPLFAGEREVRAIRLGHDTVQSVETYCSGEAAKSYRQAVAAARSGPFGAQALLGKKDEPEKRRSGGPAPKHNLLTSEVEEVAEWIKLRIMASTNAHMVLVRDDGAVVLARHDQPTTSKPIPDHWHVGTYRKGIKVADIEDDLVARLAELRGKVAA